MKKLVMVMVLISISVLGYASDQKVIQTYPISNTNLTNYQSFSIPITSIRPGIEKVVGYSIQPLNNTSSSENIISLWDTTYENLSAENIAENEAYDGGSAVEWFPYPRKIETGLTVWQGPNTQANIYFISE